MKPSFKSASYRDICNTETFASFRGELYAVDPQFDYIKVDKRSLAGYTGKGKLQYRLARTGELTNPLAVNVDGVALYAHRRGRRRLYKRG